MTIKDLFDQLIPQNYDDKAIVKIPDLITF